MADASDSKSDEGDLVWVQVPSPASRKPQTEMSGAFLIHLEEPLEPMFNAVYTPLLYNLFLFFTDYTNNGKNQTNNR